MRALDAMCGNGPTASLLVDRGALVTGVDISPRVVSQFQQRVPAATAVCASVLNTGLAAESFDAVFITGGLHHVQPRVDDAIDELYRVLKPGGYLCFVEPHTGSLADWFRRAWYRLDPIFERNEKAVDVDQLRRKNMDRFEFLTQDYVGGIAYLLVLNSMIFRIPLSWKRWYSPLLIGIERLTGRFQGKLLSCITVVRWRKK